MAEPLARAVTSPAARIAAVAGTAPTADPLPLGRTAILRAGAGLAARLDAESPSHA
ncbi:hypothetical protein [Amaricoccus sp.]|uniref:hypothetical protein n=1 Tax=Amaricoccus sp. TaxID=1872485 RepID=UPI001B795958|nr:hypothetical protein [Amaricoccus sp.]MBP7002836.1 hypothetical protein [Amaricoccus sp.]